MRHRLAPIEPPAHRPFDAITSAEWPKTMAEGDMDDLATSIERSPNGGPVGAADGGLTAPDYRAARNVRPGPPASRVNTSAFDRVGDGPGQDPDDRQLHGHRTRLAGHLGQADRAEVERFRGHHDGAPAGVTASFDVHSTVDDPDRGGHAGRDAGDRIPGQDPVEDPVCALERLVWGRDLPVRQGRGGWQTCAACSSNPKLCSGLRDRNRWPRRMMNSRLVSRWCSGVTDAEQRTTRRDLGHLSLMQSLTCRRLMQSLDAPSVDAISGGSAADLSGSITTLPRAACRR